MSALFKNNATATLAVGISSSATTIVLSSGLGALFPSPSSGTYFYGTLYDALGNYEIVKCTARTTDSLTVVRGQEGTSPLAFAIGDGFAQRLTAGGLNNFSQLDANNAFTGNNSFAGTSSFAGVTTVPTPTTGDSSTKAATTSFVSTAIAASLGTVTGRIVQTVQAFGSVAYSTAGTYSPTGHTATITPTSASSKILVMLSSSMWQTNGYGGNSFLALYRNSTNLIGSNDWVVLSAPGQNFYGSVAFQFLDSPASTTSLSYQPFIRADSGGTTAYNATGTAVITLLEIL